MTHELKTWTEYYESLEKGIKTFELRKDDRPFAALDTLIAQEWDNIKKEYTGKEISFIITYILRDCPEFGLKKGYVILGIQPKREPEDC